MKATKLLRRRLVPLTPLWVILSAVLLAAGLGYYLRERRGALRLKPRARAYKPLAFDARDVPRTIRVLRTRLSYQRGFCVGSYLGRCIQEIDLERYLRGVVFAEEGVFLRFARSTGQLDAGKLRRIREAWRLQAIAARSYALYAVLVDKYDRRTNGFDLTDTPRDQAYVDRRHPEVDLAVDSTRGRVLVDRRGRLLYAEYSASCHSRGTRDILGQTRIPCHAKCREHGFDGSSHFRGMCQWGSLHFALDGRSLAWLVAHYYPSAKTLRVAYRPLSPAPTRERASVKPDGRTARRRGPVGAPRRRGPI